MIRMGRGSKTEPANDTSYRNQPVETPSYPYTSENSQTASSRAVSDSESMARDIKEGRLSGFVGHGTVLTGETTFQAMLRVDGHLLGTVSSDSGTLIVGTNGQVDANIVVASAMINGVVNGDIVAAEKIQLGRTARVIGNIQTPKLLIEEGAIFEGSCSMMKAREAADNRSQEGRSAYKPNETSYQAIDEVTDEDLAAVEESEADTEAASA